MKGKIILTVFIMCGLNCTLPHNNPYDPESPEYVGAGRIVGKITNRAKEPIGGAVIFLFPESLAVLTNQRGEFEFFNLKKGIYVLHIEKTNYVPCSLSIALEEGERKYIDCVLNGVPLIDTPRISSIHISRWWPPEDLYYAEIKVLISDLDGPWDIDSAWVEISELNLSFPLTYLPDSGFFFKKIYAESLPSQNLEILIGKIFSFYVKDNSGYIGKYTPAFLLRIIYEIPVPLSPQPRDTVNSRPIFVWRRFNVSFEFTYKIDIFRLEGGYPTLISCFSNFAPSETTFQYPYPLPSGEYYWTVSVIDKFSNCSTSKPYVFIVQ